MTADSLSSYTMKDLVQMAKRRGVHGCHSMRKDQLVQALVRAAKSAAAKGKLKQKSSATRRSSASTASAGRRKTARRASESATKPKSAYASRRLEQVKSKLNHSKNLSGAVVNGKQQTVNKDRLVVMVRGPYWLHAYWELTRQGVERAEAAMSQEWHAAQPVLRVFEVSANGTTSSSETLLRDIVIHGGVNNWYIDVNDPPKSFRVDIGYLAPSGKFFVLARSNVVTTPKAAASDAIDENWNEVAEDFDKIYAMSGGYAAEGPSTELQELFEERLRRPMGSPMVTRYGAGVEGLLPRKRDFNFELDAELIVYGVTDPGAHVTLQGEPVKLRDDGTFTVRFSMPNCRQVIPAVACSRDGFEQRTIVLAVERNTKTMEPLIRDGND
ncbi:MAG TPA: DUF4912 domain-containing protein [Pirellulales bacterium]|nr:DUF4912 domain-containing protein [Pirellulales bacterium]